MATEDKSRTISSWADLSRWLERYRDQGWLFRGEADPRYGALKPKVGRVSNAPGSSRKYEYTRDDEVRAFKEFKKVARPHLAYEPRSDIEWMAIAQHHGLPTRLLDWTQSLLVAAFFAVEKAFDQDGIIYCIKGIPEIRTEKDEANKLFDLTQTRMYNPPHISPRIPAQQSVFTIHPNPVSHFSHENLERWAIAKTECWTIKRNLNAAGITYRSLFPDIDGVCRHIAWLYKWAFFKNEDNSTRIETRK